MYNMTFESTESRLCTTKTLEEGLEKLNQPLGLPMFCVRSETKASDRVPVLFLSNYSWNLLLRILCKHVAVFTI